MEIELSSPSLISYHTLTDCPESTMREQELKMYFKLVDDKNNQITNHDQVEPNKEAENTSAIRQEIRG